MAGWNSLVRSVLAGSAVIAAYSTPAMAASVTNGSFESCTGSSNTTCSTGLINSGSSATGTTNPSGWTTTSNYSFLITPSAITNGILTTTGPYNNITMNWGAANNANGPGTGALSPDGGDFIIADGNLGSSYAGTLSQTITGLVVGSLYQIGFYQAASEQSSAGQNFTQGPTTDDWQVSFGNQTLYSATISDTAGAFVPWTYQTINFYATAASMALGFFAQGTGAPPFLALDGVSITQVVPEPSTYGMLGFGLMALVMFARRQRRTAAPSRR